jgi:hypothetical protein
LNLDEVYRPMEGYMDSLPRIADVFKNNIFIYREIYPYFKKIMVRFREKMLLKLNNIKCIKKIY